MMNLIRNKAGSSKRVWLGIVILLALGTPGFAFGQEGASPLQVTITNPKELFVDQPAKFRIHLLNTDTKDTPDRMELVIAYGTLGNADVQFNGRLFVQDFRADEMVRVQELAEAVAEERKGNANFTRINRSFIPQANPTNSVRETRITVASLAPKESRTVSVTLTPRRTGEFRLAVTVGNQMFGSKGVLAKFEPNRSVKDLLPAAFGHSLKPRLPKTLAEVAEIGLESPLSATLKADEAFEHVAHLMDKVNLANAKNQDAFAVALLEKRDDIHGIPMTMGEGCRLKPERAANFLNELSQLRTAMAQSPNGNGLSSRMPHVNNEKLTSARIAGMMQVLGPEGVQMRQEMIKFLSAEASTEATEALAKLAVFSEEEQVRTAAIDTLKNRKDQDYTAILVRGLSYPWPAVAQNAANAIVKLNRKDLMGHLVDALEQPDPRAPQTQNGKQVVREMVKINHLRNCMLCHPPGSADQNLQFDGGGKGMPGGPLLAQVPIPNQPLPASPGNGGGYGQFTVPDTVVRFDVTYLRQDFSVMLNVEDHQPWPQTQRFDFIVRTREVTEKDAQTYRNLLRQAGVGDQSPYQRVAVAALREMTGRDASSAPAWRQIIEQLKAEGKF
jgi:HEAT repeats